MNLEAERNSIADILAKSLAFVKDMRLPTGSLRDGNSALRRMLISCLEWKKRAEFEFLGSPFSDQRDRCSQTRDIAALAEFTRSYSLIRTSRKRERLQPHLQELVATEDFGQAYPASGTAGSRTVFELQMAMAALYKFGDVDLEPPNGDDKKPHPDIIFPFAKRLMGLACKSLTARNPSDVLKHFKKGIEQLEKAKRRVDELSSGVVLIDISRALPQGDFLSYDKGYTYFKKDDAIRALDDCMSEYIANCFPIGSATKLAANSPMRPGVLFFGNVAVITESIGISSIKRLRHVRLHNDDLNHRWHKSFNLALHQQP